MIMTIVVSAFLVFVLILFLVFAVEFLIPRLLIALGNIDTWWSPVRTLPPPGEMYILVRGDPNGPYDSVIESVPDFQYDPVTNTFNGPGLEKNPPDDYLGKLGLVWVDFWKYFLWREVRYEKLAELPSDPTKTGIVSRVRGIKGQKGQSPSIYFQYYMAAKIDGAETEGNIPIDAVITFTARIMNPVKAFFFAGNWAGQVGAAIQAVFREYVSNKSVETIRQEHATGADTLIEWIKNLNANLLELFGVEIIDARFVKFEPVGNEKMFGALQNVEIARLEAEADQLRGEGQRKFREEEAKGIRKTVEAWGSDPVGGTAAMAEAIAKAKPAALGGNFMASIDTSRKKEEGKEPEKKEEG